MGNGDISPTNNGASHDYHNLMNQRSQPTFAQLQPNFTIQAMTNGHYRETTPGLLQTQTSPSMTHLMTPSTYHHHHPSGSPRDGNSPPGLHPPNVSGTPSPVDSPHSLSPPQPTALRHNLQLQPAHQLTGSPNKDHQYAPLTTMAVPGFPAPLSAGHLFTSAGHDQFPGLSSLSQDLRLGQSSQNIQHWLQQVPGHRPQSPVKNEPMSPRYGSECGCFKT
jgi:hypothetical protein